MQTILPWVTYAHQLAKTRAATGAASYAVYDYEYTSPERGTFKKLVFLLW